MPAYSVLFTDISMPVLILYYFLICLSIVFQKFLKRNFGEIIDFSTCTKTPEGKGHVGKNTFAKAFIPHDLLRTTTSSQRNTA